MGAVRAVAAAVLRLAPDDADVQDCTNETLRRAVEGRDRLRAGEQLRPWVLGIARHVALDALRRRKRLGHLHHTTAMESGADDGPSRLESVPDPAAGPEELLERARRRSEVHHAMTSLPEPMAVALMKFHLDGRTYQEIAKELNVPLGTVATWVTRGRKALAERLGQESR
jgi:RNA polymerase sigma factor (sigma-70 family)